MPSQPKGKRPARGSPRKADKTVPLSTPEAEALKVEFADVYESLSELKATALRVTNPLAVDFALEKLHDQLVSGPTCSHVVRL